MDENVNEVYRVLTSIRPHYTSTDGQEIRVRCPFCLDSTKDLSAAHFYVNMKPPFKFHCFKCETSGALNSKVLSMLNVFDNDAALAIVSANKNLREDSGVQKVTIKNNKVVNEVTDSERSTQALDYFNKRFGLNFTKDFVTKKFKAVLDAPYLFEKNNLRFSNNLFNYSEAIGFISSDNSHIVFRDICGKQNKRYNNLCIASNESVNSKMYNISNNIDLMSTDVELIITEGIFDIIGVYSHFYLNNDKNKIFAAACGKSFNAVILKYIQLGFLNMRISIYSDGDVDLSFYKKMKAESPYLKNTKIDIYYNGMYNPKTKESKDYGIPLSQIQLRKFTI